MKFATLTAVASANVANLANMKLDLFAPENFKNAIQTLIKNPQPAGLQDVGIVTWSQCADDLGVFQFDESSTTYSPDPITKGKPVNLDVHGIVSAPIDVTDIHVHCDWNHAPVYN